MAPRQRSRKPVQKLATSPLFIIVHQGACTLKPLLTELVKGFRPAPKCHYPSPLRRAGVMAEGVGLPSFYEGYAGWQKSSSGFLIW